LRGGVGGHAGAGQYAALAESIPAGRLTLAWQPEIGFDSRPRNSYFSVKG
jgi:hypothetical protein